MHNTSSSQHGFRSFERNSFHAVFTDIKSTFGGFFNSSGIAGIESAVQFRPQPPLSQKLCCGLSCEAPE
jgi:hypothetical protein